MPSPNLTLIHTSDWHLGHVLAAHEREAEHQAFLDWLLDQLDSQDADVLLVTGDIFDVANPPVTATRRLYRFLADAARRRPNMKTVILGGNHDSAARINLPAPLLDETRVRFFGALPRRATPEGGSAPDFDALLVPLPGADGKTAAWLAAVPFCRPGDLGTHSLATLYAEVADAAAARADDLPLILTGHLHVAGGEISELSERRIVVGGEEAQAATLFDARPAYVALGHLHRAQTISGPCPIRYAGSPFPLSATERDYHHTITVVCLSEGKAAIREVAIPRPVRFLAVPNKDAAPLDGVILELEALALEADLPRDRHPFLEVNVAVTGPEPHLQARIFAALEGKPVRLVRIVRQQVTVAEQPSALAGVDLDTLQPEAVFAALYAARHGGNLPPEDLADAFARLVVEVNTSAHVGEEA